MTDQHKTCILAVTISSVLLSVSISTCLSLKRPRDSATIALFSEVTVSSTCRNDVNEISCNNTCPTRTQLPPNYLKLLKAKGDNCNDANQRNGLAEAANGNIMFNDNSNCTSVNETVYSTTRSFSFSVWIKQDGSFNTTLFDFGGQLNLAVIQKLLVVNNQRISKLDVNKTWNHVTIRNNGYLDVFINGQKFSNYSGTTPSRPSYQLTIGPNKELTSTHVLNMADARWYQDVLTDREIKELATGRFPSLDINSDCRCPDSYPTLHTSSDSPAQRYLTCIDRHGNKTQRLNTDAHPADYLIDGDNKTRWISEMAMDATITINLTKIMQIKGIRLHGLQTYRGSLSVALRTGNKVSLKMEIKPSCKSPCNRLSDVLRGTSVVIDLEDEYLELDVRSNYEQLLANTIEILFDNNTYTFFTVSEIEIHARCPCYGNDDNCIIHGLDYSCNCSDSSNTSGVMCETCRDEFYRESRDFDCQYPCSCNLNGRENNICRKVGGQCDCKSNVNNSTRACDACKFNTVNLGSDVRNGCTACSCNPEGIKYCKDDFTCVCKDNVEQDSGNCTKCLYDYYGIEKKAGCSPCECDDVGTQDTVPNTCNMTSGLCPCKLYVTGRTCNTCKNKYFNLDKSEPYGCESCKCNFVGRKNEVCDKITGHCACRQLVTGNTQCKPNNLHLEPDYGPMAGGTKITISGDLLGDNTTEVRLTVSDPLELDFKSDTQLTAKTKRHTSLGPVPVTVVWFRTGETEPYKDDDLNLMFTYKEDPTITLPSEIITTYASGGCTIDIYGENLDNVPHPELFTYGSRHFFSSPCSHTDLSQQIACLTADVKIAATEGDLMYGIGLDNVRTYKRFPMNLTALRIVPDPNVTINARIEYRNTFDNTITIKGFGLNTACKDADVRILIDNSSCTLLSRSESEIICDPQEGFPGKSREATVLLYIGNIEIEVGKVIFINFWSTSEAYIIIGCVCGGVLLIIVAVITICICRRCRNNGMSRLNSKSTDGIEMNQVARTPNNYVDMQPVVDSTPVAKTPIPATNMSPTKDFLKLLQPTVAKAVKTSLVDRSQIEPGRVCTQKGGLIRVINGQFSTTSSSPFAGTTLTIKTLIDPYEAAADLPSWLTDGLVECTKLRDCYNENVLTLLGISIDDKHIYILYPEMSNKSLKDYMSNASRTLSEQKRLKICKQVAEGMNFLDAEHIVHKDLATRNCWVESNEVVKVGDSSFSWDLYPDEYLLQNDRYQPVRWMAPESLRQPGFYNSKTDVWSFGVLMWEVFTNAYLPYPDIEDDTQIKHYVCEAGYRLGKPHACSDKIYSVIELCHGSNSQNRPNFFIILNHLSEIMSGGNPMLSYGNQNFTEDDEADYMNTAVIMERW